MINDPLDPFVRLVTERQLYKFELTPGTDWHVLEETIRERDLQAHIVWMLPQPDGSISLSATAHAAKVIKMVTGVINFEHVEDDRARSRKLFGLNEG